MNILFFFHSGGTKKSCEFRYNKNTKKLEKQSECQLDEHEGRVHLAGNYNNHECGIRISDAILSDSGEWKVEVTDIVQDGLLYLDMFNKTSGYYNK